MLTRLNKKNGDELSILGFGCMRFPMKGNSIDEEKTTSLIRTAIEKGINYFDTAYPYHGGKSEVMLGKALEGGYRERIMIADKLPHYLVGSLERAKKIFDTQLSRLNTDYIDYYLIHMLSDCTGFERLEKLGVMSWLEDLKKQGIIKNLGFSFHGSKKDFEELVTAYPWDLCQIQYNYLDENNQATRSGLDLAHSMGLPVIIMEPLRGGQLVNNLPKEVIKEFGDYKIDRSPAEWSLRWIWNHPEVTLILSGMNEFSQLDENIATASTAESGSLTSEEMKIYDRVKKIILEKTKVPCTGCAYCMPCPAGVNIPQCFTAYNDKYLLGARGIRFNYMMNLGGGAKKPAFASLCIDCGKCEKHCPQHIEIRKELKNVKKELEGSFFKPVVAIARKVMKVG